MWQDIAKEPHKSFCVLLFDESGDVQANHAGKTVNTRIKYVHSKYNIVSYAQIHDQIEHV